MTNTEAKVKEMKNAYYKKWRAENKDKIKQYDQNYWNKKATQDLEQNK